MSYWWMLLHDMNETVEEVLDKNGILGVIRLENSCKEGSDFFCFRRENDRLPYICIARKIICHKWAEYKRKRTFVLHLHVVSLILGRENYTIVLKRSPLRTTRNLRQLWGRYTRMKPDQLTFSSPLSAASHHLYFSSSSSSSASSVPSSFFPVAFPLPFCFAVTFLTGEADSDFGM